jgi:hypothetical protein
MLNRRKVSRYLFAVAAKLSEPDNPGGLDVRVVNISREGCCVEAPGPLPLGERRVLVIGWRAKEIQAEVAVVWSDAPAPGGRAGLRFLSVRRQDQATLRDLCSTLAIQRAARTPSQAA